MKLSLSWLEEYVDCSGVSPQELAQQLTMKAFEVEELVKIGDKLEGNVVLGEIREIAKHPDADKLQVTQTCIGYNADGSENIQQIVCGARNIAIGQKVPVATIGSKVVDRHSGGSLEIKKSKIRGIESCGMLCSPDELGYSETEATSIRAKQGDGIYLLADPSNPAIENIAAKHKLGADIRKVLNMQVDYVLDVGARSNRGDALSIYGQAREISALLNKTLKTISTADKKITDIKNIKADTKIKTVKPVISDTGDCAVFYTITIEGLKVTESPAWLKSRLEAVGQKSINNVVDVSNYVLLELGQPLHFYDRAKLNGDSLTVRRATPGEAFRSLADLDYKLSETNLVIADATGPECLAGVMGGARSQVTESTTSIVIEAAAFSAATVRRSARAAGIESESKRRFERGVDKSNTKTAILRAVELLASFDGQTLSCSELEKAGSDEITKSIVKLKLSDIKRYLGVEIEVDQISKLLSPLAIKLESKSNTELSFSLPSFRQNDISRAEDLIEEIGRLYGFDNIPALAPKAAISSLETEAEAIRKKIQNTLVAEGYSQVILSSLVGESLRAIGAADQNLSLNNSAISMHNPLSLEHSVLRQSLIPGLVQATSRNFAYDRSNNIRLYEIGKTYFKASPELARKLGVEIQKDTNTIEKTKVAAIMLVTNEAWDAGKTSEPFYKFKTIVENLYPRAEFRNPSESDINTEFSFSAYTHPGIAATVFQDKREIGYIARLHPSIAKEQNLPDNVYILELDLPKLSTSQFKAIATTPIVERDLTVDTNVETSSAAIAKIIRSEAGAELTSLRLISRFQKDKNSPIALSYRLKWQSATETLSGEAIDAKVSQIKSLLEAKLGVRFRI